MPKRCRESRLYLLACTLAAGLFLLTGSSLLPPAAKADQLDGVPGPVNEVVAPVQSAVEQVVAPVTAPPSTPSPAAAPPPIAQPPEVAVPKAPAKVPEPPPAPKAAEGATQTAAAAPRAASEAAGALTTAAESEAASGSQAAAEATAAAQGTIDSSTAAAEAALSAPPPAATSSMAAPSGSAGATPSQANADPGSASSGAGATTAPPEGPGAVLPRFPARDLEPFIHVWPAIALLAEGRLGPLAGFVGDWSRAVTNLLEEGKATSPRGETPPLADPPPAAPAPGGQPPFSSFSPTLTPFGWVADESALVVLALFLVLAASALAMLVLGRRELGLPMFRRGNRFPWRH